MVTLVAGEVTVSVVATVVTLLVVAIVAALLVVAAVVTVVTLFVAVAAVFTAFVVVSAGDGFSVCCKAARAAAWALLSAEFVAGWSCGVELVCAWAANTLAKPTSRMR
jgi:hypothetical protein